jgi:uncharacterized protein YbjT (DUF2867 family)
MTRILVTGALGNVGRAVATACLAEGREVRLAVQNSERAETVFPGQERCVFDFCDRRTWAPALRGCGQLFLLRPPPIGDMDRTLNPFVDEAYAAGVEHIVFLSVQGADTRTWVPHHAVERHLAASGSRHTLLRPGFFAQNLEDAYRRDIVEDNRLYVPAGSGRVAFVDARDLGDVAARVFAEPACFQARGLLLTGPEALPFARVAALLSTTLGRAIRYEPATIPGYAHHLRAHREMPWMQIAIQTILHVGLRSGEAETVDPTLPRLLGRPPRSLESYLADAVRSGAWTSRS